MQREQVAPLRDGTVTRLLQQANDPERVGVYLDGEGAFTLAMDIAIAAGLHVGLPLSAERQEVLLDQDRIARARVAALGYLAASARTAMEIRRSLRRRGFDDAVADDVVEWARERGYVNDSEYALAYVRARFGGHGAARLRQDLMRRGVEREEVDAALAAVLEDADTGEAALDAAAPRWRALAGEADSRRRRQKTLEFLVRRGFSYDDAREAVERLAAEAGADGHIDDAA